MGLLIIRGFMKKLFILFMSLVIAAPVFTFSLDKRRHLNFGEQKPVPSVLVERTKSGHRSAWLGGAKICIIM